MEAFNEISFEESVQNLSREGKRTLGLVNRKRSTPLGTSLDHLCAVFDNTAPPYGWLHSGWMVEIRRMRDTGRPYKYYYNPAGKKYDTHREVISACKNFARDQIAINLD